VVVVEAKKKVAKMKKKSENEDVEQNVADVDMRPMNEEQIEFHRRCKEKRAALALKMAEIDRDAKRQYEEIFGKQEVQVSQKAKRKKKGKADVKQTKEDSAHKKDEGGDEVALTSDALSVCNGDDNLGAPEEAVYIIERFLKLKTVQGKVSVLVRWEGGENTWEPEDHLRNDLGNETVDDMIREMKMVSLLIETA
jgi:hypothetical protein